MEETVRTRANVFLVGLIIVLGIGVPEALRAQQSSTAAPSSTIEKPIGKIISATGDVRVQHTTTVVLQAAVSANVRANTGDLVYQGDIIQTGASGKLDITFTDGTTFNV